MMQKHAQPMSPRTQAFAQGAPSGDEETRLFEEGFSQMAYNVMVSKFPDLVQSIVTFKILDTDVENGAGAGAFVVQRDSEVLYIPVIMADNQIKPLDMFYHKALNVFLPLNNDWLDEVQQLTLDEIGESVRPPKSLRRNVDTRNIMVPPTTGRYAYAAAQSEPLTEAVISDDLYTMLNLMQKTASDDRHSLLDFLHKAPEQIKEAFRTVLTSRPKLASQVTLLYGLDPLTNALAQTKEASATSHKGGALYVADRDTPASEYKRIFGDKAPEAYQGVLINGYKAQDNRENLDSAVQIQGEDRLTTPSESGFYRVYTRDGKKLDAFILHNPRKITDASLDKGPEGRRGKRHDTLGFGQHSKDFVVVTQGGKWLRTSELVAEPTERAADGPAALFNPLANEKGGANPRVGDRGLFVFKKGKTYIGTQPFRIKSVTTSNGVRRITTQDWDNTVLVTDKNAAKMGLHQPKGEPLVYIPSTAHFIRLQDEPMMSSDLLKTPTQVHRWFKDKFDSMGANSASVKNAGANQFSIGGEAPVTGMAAAIKQAALKYNIHADEAEQLVKQAAALPNGRAIAFILSPEMLEKMAQVPMMGDPAAAAGGGMPPGGMPPGGMPPEMAGAAPPPAPPSPLDIAMGEAQTQLQQQMADLQGQAMALQDKAQTLQLVQQRAQEVATGGQAAVQQGAPPMPMPGAAPGAVPGAAPPPQGGAMPAPAPEMVGETMGATMATEAPSAMEIQQQVNPQFLEQAGELNDTGVFDAAAIASMAQSPSFRDMVVDYVPTLERALDNLGRVLLTMWMQEAELKERIGDEDYSDLEDNVRAVFDGLGDLILQMNRNAIVMQEEVSAG